MFHVKHRTTTEHSANPPRFTWNPLPCLPTKRFTWNMEKHSNARKHNPNPRQPRHTPPILQNKLYIKKLIQCPQTWLVSISKEDQVRWHILSDFPSADVDKFFQRLNKLQTCGVTPMLSTKHNCRYGEHYLRKYRCFTWNIKHLNQNPSGSHNDR